MFWFKSRNFLEVSEICTKIRHSDHYEHVLDEKMNDSFSFIFYTKNYQRTWLILSNLNIYIVLDDKDSLTILLKLRINDFKGLLDVINNSENYGIMKFSGATHRTFYYRKFLFPSAIHLEKRIREYIEAQRERSNETV